MKRSLVARSRNQGNQEIDNNDEGAGQAQTL
jgi:hypothetical protein